jgi:hypothetical protein
MFATLDRNFDINVGISELRQNVYLILGRLSERNCGVKIGRAMRDACSATWNFEYQLNISDEDEENKGRRFSNFEPATAYKHEFHLESM